MSAASVRSSRVTWSATAATFTGSDRRALRALQRDRADRSVIGTARAAPLNPNGNRQLNHAIHIAALGQISHNTPGRAYYLAKQADGKSRKEAMRCLKRRISDAVYRQLVADTTR